MFGYIQAHNMLDVVLTLYVQSTGGYCEYIVNMWVFTNISSEMLKIVHILCLHLYKHLKKIKKKHLCYHA